jgi:hypothetical protein
VRCPEPAEGKREYFPFSVYHFTLNLMVIGKIDTVRLYFCGNVVNNETTFVQYRNFASSNFNDWIFNTTFFTNPSGYFANFRPKAASKPLPITLMCQGMCTRLAGSITTVRAFYCSPTIKA